MDEKEKKKVPSSLNYSRMNKNWQYFKLIAPVVLTIFQNLIRRGGVVQQIRDRIADKDGRKKGLTFKKQT